jgi:hypothetical protein
MPNCPKKKRHPENHSAPVCPQGLPQDIHGRAFSARVSVFNKFTLEKETAVTHLKLALSSLLYKNEFIISGYSGLLLPRKMTHGTLHSMTW